MRLIADSFTEPFPESLRSHSGGEEDRKRRGLEWILFQDQVDNLTVGTRAPRDWTWQ